MLTVVAVPSRLLPAWDQWRHEQQQAARELTAELSRSESSIHRVSELEDSLVARRTRFLALAPAILSGSSPQESGVALIGFLTSAAREAGVRTGPMQLRVDSTGPRTFVPLRVEMSITGDVTGLAELIAQIERGPLLLILTRFSISQPEPAAPSDRPEQLQAQLVVEGLTLLRPEDPDGQ